MAAEPERPDVLDCRRRVNRSVQPSSTLDHPANQQILTALADARLKRLVSRGILLEPDPGLLACPGT
ncbi:hypothetical protein [Streptomyces fractus]|uniref:hypothetical protein n=1 Tax=Streptomyces fractus TaxID=641806 RepID=UPI003CE83129